MTYVVNLELGKKLYTLLVDDRNDIFSPRNIGWFLTLNHVRFFWTIFTLRFRLKL